MFYVADLTRHQELQRREPETAAAGGGFRENGYAPPGLEELRMTPWRGAAPPPWAGGGM